MKRRICFVSNSSSSSFMLRNDDNEYVDEDRELLDTSLETDKLRYLKMKVTEVQDLAIEDYEIFDKMHAMLDELIEVLSE